MMECVVWCGGNDAWDGAKSDMPQRCQLSIQFATVDRSCRHVFYPALESTHTSCSRLRLDSPLTASNSLLHPTVEASSRCFALRRAADNYQPNVERGFPLRTIPSPVDYPFWLSNAFF
ncbi:unnamed protein product [Sphenostylis stenocarpa]|uniref:Uncharacterized protein n=1 Tax=Sphenostylis stenocarpa TaxID=92480 RepID=A0AA86RY49_9FABA|nr:unnamed protein product [Sphenostylis stenocarpa]